MFQKFLFQKFFKSIKPAGKKNLAYVRKALPWCLQVLYPSFCYSCRNVFSQKIMPPTRRHVLLCESCEKKIIPISTFELDITKKNSITVYAVSAYVDPLRSLILKKSYSELLASRALGLLMYEKSGIKNNFDYIVPVPLHWTRYARRGFNQAGEMARVLGKKMGVPVVDVVRRARRTKFQSSLSFVLRQKNVENVFDVRRRYRDIFTMMLQDKDILLVDDLFTTGATIKNVARVLLEGYPKSITVVVACRVIK